MKFRGVIIGMMGLLLPLTMPGQEIKAVTERLETVFKILRPAERKALTDGYVAALSSSLLTAKEKTRIDSVFLDLLALRVTVSPELKGFVSAVNGFCRRGEKANLLVWLKGMEEALSAPERKRLIVKDYLAMTSDIAGEGLVYNGTNHQWGIQGKMIWYAEEPIRIGFEDADLICRTKKDSIRIMATRGNYRLGSEWLEGMEGKVKWKDMDDDVSAELTHYRIRLKLSGYTADSVWFHYESKYERPLLGQLKDNALKYTRPKDTGLPEFSSYDTNVHIRDIFNDISFRGGVTYVGRKFSGTGTAEHPAALTIAPNDTISMTLYSRQFLFDSVRIMSGSAAMVIRLDSGEITHSDVNFLYQAASRSVSVKRITEKSLHLPFKDTYHRILFDMEEIYWPLDSNEMKLMMSSRSGLLKATIESMNYFSDGVYDELQGIDEVNPLNGLLKCSLLKKSDVFTIAEYAEFMKKPADQLRKQIVLLSYRDFVDYNETRDEVTLKSRLVDYTKARVGKQDYDNIRFASQPGKSRLNATLDVRNFNLRIRGVDKFVISEARNISVEPADREVMMMKNRDMAFNGKLNAGMFDMYGNNLFFSYDDYRIDLAKVDSTGMYLAGRDKNIRGRRVKSLIRDITGEIIIDKPGNKSGKEEDATYPILNSTKESYVYFDDPVIQQGKYKRDSFYYVINPYTIKGINDTEKFRYAFGGTLVSNIVSPIKDTLRLMPDNALGLTYRIPAAGIELYGKGRLYNQVCLNRNGFVANGKVSMNRSNFQSDSILMLPRQMTAQTEAIQVLAVKDKRPEAQGKKVRIKYLPETGTLQATSTTQPFDVYEGRIKHDGKLLVYEDLLDASGRLEVEGANLASALFHLQANGLSARKSSLNIASVLNKDICINTADVKAEIDLVANKGTFVNNGEANRVDFISSRYSCSFESFIWDMKEACLNIGLENQEELSRLWKTEDAGRLPKAGRNMFVCRNPLADSLNFVAPSARYDLKAGDIACRGVNHIDIANGRFYPAIGEVDIHPDGKIKEFIGGRLLCERSHKDWQLTNVNLKLQGRFRFSGTGDYTYVSEEKKESVIRFTELGVDTARLIFAKALIKEDSALLLNDGLKYKGNITLYSGKPDLYYSGCVGLTLGQSTLKSSWMSVKAYLSAARIQIPVKTENRDDKQQRIYNGIYLHTDQTFKPYAAFMSNRHFYNDDLLVGGRGKMEWSGALKQYIIQDTATDKYYRFRYDPEEATVSAFSAIDVDLKLPGVYQKIAGNIRYELKNERLKMNNLLYLIDFTVLGKMEAILLKDFGEQKLKTIGVNPDLTEKIYEIRGKNEMPELEKQLQRPSGNVPDSLNQLFVIDSLYMTWNPQTRSYMANGRAHMVAMHRKPVGKRMNIKLELLRSRSGNQFFMYIYDDNMWYYFEYSDGSLYSLSSNEEYNAVLKLEKAEKKVIQDKEKKTLYTLTLCPESKIERFLKRVKN